MFYFEYQPKTIWYFYNNSLSWFGWNYALIPLGRELTMTSGEVINSIVGINRPHVDGPKLKIATNGAQRAFPGLSTPPLCSKFRVDCENGNESVPHARNRSKIQLQNRGWPRTGLNGRFPGSRPHRWEAFLAQIPKTATRAPHAEEISPTFGLAPLIREAGS